jgi:hypothetical protein
MKSVEAPGIELRRPCRQGRPGKTGREGREPLRTVPSSFGASPAASRAGLWSPVFVHNKAQHVAAEAAGVAAAGRSALRWPSAVNPEPHAVPVDRERQNAKIEPRLGEARAEPLEG